MSAAIARDRPLPVPGLPADHLALIAVNDRSIAAMAVYRTGVFFVTVVYADREEWRLRALLPKLAVEQLRRLT